MTTSNIQVELAGRSEDGRLWKEINNRLFLGYEPVKVPTIDPTLSYIGGKLSIEEWRKGLCFLVWNYDKNKDEGLLFILGNVDRPEVGLKLWAPPQSGRGMTVNALFDHERYAPGRASFPDHPDFFGTIHDHCNGNAFQSGTDRGSETDQDGLHITLGGLAGTDLSIHSRVYFKKQEYHCALHQWINLPPIPAQWMVLPKALRDKIHESLLTSAPTKSVWDAASAFPPEWKENVIKVASFPHQVQQGTYYHQEWMASQRGLPMGGTAPANGANGVGSTTKGLSKKERRWLKKYGTTQPPPHNPNWAEEWKKLPDGSWVSEDEYEARCELFASLRRFAGERGMNRQAMMQMLMNSNRTDLDDLLELHGVIQYSEKFDFCADFWNEEADAEKKNQQSTQLPNAT